jgi:hypothetical protein
MIDEEATRQEGAKAELKANFDPRIVVLSSDNGSM